MSDTTPRGARQRLAQPLGHTTDPARAVWGPSTPQGGVYLQFLPVTEDGKRPEVPFDEEQAVSIWRVLTRLAESHPALLDEVLQQACEILRERQPGQRWELEANATLNKRGQVNGLVLDPTLRAKALLLAQQGNYLTTIAKAIGITPDLLAKWMERHPDFGDELRQARAQAEANDLQIIGQAVNPQGDPDWKARAWKLERLYPQRYGQRVQVMVQQQFDEALERLQVEFKNEPEILLRALDAIAGGDGRGDEALPAGVDAALPAGVPGSALPSAE